MQGYWWSFWHTNLYQNMVGLRSGRWKYGGELEEDPHNEELSFL